jgi:CHAT domain-containing protein
LLPAADGSNGSAQPRAGAVTLTAVAESNLRGGTLKRLPRTSEEAKNILALTTAGQSLAWMAFDASKVNAESPALADFKIVHFASHGVIDRDHPALSGIVFSLYDPQGRSVDGFLRLNEVFNLKLPVDLVVLSACQSGQGKLVSGEGLVGLARGFLYAGAASMVVSLWSVDDQATAELMSRFYRKMLGPDHLRPAAALRAAQLSMLSDANQRWNRPVYWAPFIIQGDW